MLNKGIKIVCDNCKHEFLLKSEDVESAEVKIDNQQLTLVYFVCPKCNKLYRVSIQDQKYNELKDDIENTKARMRRSRGNKNIEMARMLNQMVNKKLERLRNYADKLNKRFSGTFVLVVSEDNQEKFIKYLP